MWGRTASELAAGVRDGTFSAREVMEAHLERIAAVNPRVNAIVTLVAPEAALAAADAADRARAQGEPLGVLHGLPLAVKDLEETAGLRTTYGSPLFAEHVPDADSLMVARLRRAGGIIIGKTNTPEFGTIAMTESELNGDCRNPWDTARTPGGSSGGAAAAVAAGLAPVAHASDGGGSIRIPASCCGLFGIKPSRGRVSPAPFVSGSLGLGTSGPIARTVRDAAALLDVMSGNEPGDFYIAPALERPFLDEAGMAPGRLRIAVTVEPPSPVPVDPACAAAARAAGELLSGLGHEVVEATPPWQTDEMIVHFTRIWQVGPATAGVDDLSLLEPINRMLAEDARTTPSPQYVSSVMQLQQIARRVAAFWNDVDIVVTPTLALQPVPVGWTWQGADGDPYRAFASQTLFTPFTPLVNVTGQPAMSVPLHWSDNGLPVGTQFIGREFGETTLIRLAAQLEQARPWAHRRPPVS
jgi:amidase